MSTIYRIHSKSFGLHLGKLASGLILPFANAINFAARVSGQYAYYAVCSLKNDWPKKEILYLKVYNESFNVDENRLVNIFNHAYFDIFLPLVNPVEIKIAFSFSDYYIDEYNQYCKDIVVADEFFYQYHNGTLANSFLRCGSAAGLS